MLINKLKPTYHNNNQKDRPAANLCGGLADFFMSSSFALILLAGYQMFFTLSDVKLNQNDTRLKKIWVKFGFLIGIFFFIMMICTIGLMESKGDKHYQKITATVYDIVIIIFDTITAVFSFRLARKLKKKVPKNNESMETNLLNKLTVILIFDAIIFILVALLNAYFIYIKWNAEKTSLAWYYTRFNIWPYFSISFIKIIPTLSVIIFIFGKQNKVQEEKNVIFEGNDLNTHLNPKISDSESDY
ncbi:hypothetical protein M0813_06334 [Anaeramoeba flamelloides]|uniref:Uncharacterized protein n=1 Tax=Anaeramoeba flamelloides TaxID=1746091 RepID=A0AAV8AG29_9EUKA|nr:hypothetical protein M0812_03586 [Anaeramoeba flamelloides]KAJ6230768.1 hypothetical protein M0813_06334 [Anaeramoeba flamelloides]